MSRHLFLLISCHLFSCYLIKTVLIQFLVLLMSGGSSWSFFYCLFICTEPYLKWVFQGFSFSRDGEVGSLRFRQVKTISEDLFFDNRGAWAACAPQIKTLGWGHLLGLFGSRFFYLYILASEFQSMFLLLLFGLWFQILLRPFFTSFWQICWRIDSFVALAIPRDVELYECSCLLINGCKISLCRFSSAALSQKYVLFFAYTCFCLFLRSYKDAMHPFHDSSLIFQFLSVL
jgi:hypothetical protein